MRALVTGGGGFLGGAIVRRLFDRGDQVVSVQRGAYTWLDELGVPSVRTDLSHPGCVATLRDAMAGVDVVFHVAAKAGVWGPAAEYEAANVHATDHVLQACGEAGVARLVYTSTPSVVFDGRDETGIDESAPYPQRFLNAYQRTKAAAEQRVLAANGDGLATVALRPHLIWGPGDPHLVPRLVERAKAGRLKLVGDGSNRVDSTYVDNAALVHVNAADRLIADGPRAACAGRAYFISNGEPLAMRELINGILGAAGLPPVQKRVPPGVAYTAGAVLETAYKCLGIRSEPIMTRFVARQLATEHWFDLTAARRDLGYEPVVTMREGLERLRESLT